MAFYPHVNPGDAFTPSALLENNIRDCVNAYNLGTGSAAHGARGSALRVAVWNGTGENLEAGQAVALDTIGLDGVIRCVKFDADQRPWGVLESGLPAGGIGDCVVGGIVRVPFTGDAEAGDRVMPVLGETPAYAAVPGGDAKLLSYGDGQAVILLETGKHYSGSFKVALMKMILPAGEDEVIGETLENGVLGVANGKLTVYPVGNCDGEEITPEEPEITPDGSTASGGTETVLALIDGANPNAAFCGEIRLGATRIKVARRAFLNWKQNCDLYLVLQTDGESVSVFPASEMPDYGTLLARIICRNGAYSVVQEHFGALEGAGCYAG